MAKQECDVCNAKRMPVGESFDDLEIMQPRIFNFGGKEIQKISRLSDAHLHSIIEQNLATRERITKLTNVQKYAIPGIYGGDDLIVSSPTGTGKTAAYLFPILSTLLTETTASKKASPYALIVSPTRELGIQIMNEAKRFIHNSGRNVRLVYGGIDVRRAKKKLKKGCDILIGTPGRLSAVLERDYIKLSHCRYIVVDDVDRYFEDQFKDDVVYILYKYYIETDVVYQTKRKQTLMFSATYPRKFLKGLFENLFIDSYFNFIAFDLMINAASKHVDQDVKSYPKSECLSRLFKLLNDVRFHIADQGPDLSAMGKMYFVDFSQQRNHVNIDNNIYEKKTLVFVNRKIDVVKVCNQLNDAGIPIEMMGIYHGDMEQIEREKSLTKFRKGAFPILIATSVASRGLNIVDVDRVINYNLPRTIYDYIHRIGRTGRLGNRGIAISFFDDRKLEDKLLAPRLVKVLADALQVVPPFLLPYASNIDGYGKQDDMSFQIKDILRNFERDRKKRGF